MKKILVLIICSILIITGCNKKTEDITPPSNQDAEEKITYSLELKGEETITLEYNGTYEEPGFVAVSSDGKDLNDEVKVESNIKNAPGEYEVTYTLQTEEETLTKTRKVVVKEMEITENAPFVPVLMYHYFYDDENGETGADGNYLAKTDFIAQLEYLKQNNYYFPTMKELREYVDGKRKLPEKSIILTMDDGAESNYRIAYPLAVQYQIPIIWFVVTSWTDPNMEYQQQIIKSGYVSMESHTHDMHKAGCSGMGHGGYFQCVSKEEGIKDLTTSKEMLKTATTVAYPFGDYNDNTKEIVKEAGYEMAFTTEWGVVKPGMDPYALPRVRISAGNSLQTFINSIT